MASPAADQDPNMNEATPPAGSEGPPVPPGEGDAATGSTSPTSESPEDDGMPKKEKKKSMISKILSKKKKGKKGDDDEDGSGKKKKRKKKKGKKDDAKPVETITPGPPGAPLPLNDSVGGPKAMESGVSTPTPDEGDESSSSESESEDEDDTELAEKNILSRFFLSIFNKDVIERFQHILAMDEELLGPTFDETVYEYIAVVTNPKGVEKGEGDEDEDDDGETTEGGEGKKSSAGKGSKKPSGPGSLKGSKPSVPPRTSNSPGVEPAPQTGESVEPTTTSTDESPTDDKEKSTT